MIYPTSKFDNDGEKFTWLLEQVWEHKPYSSISPASGENPYYQAIVGMGRAALPLIYRDLKRGEKSVMSGHWSAALSYITQANPVSYEDRGKIAKMAEDWISWLEDHPDILWDLKE